MTSEMWMKGLAPEMVVKAKDELGETEDVKTICLKQLKDLINGDNSFIPLKDDTFLLRFLRAKKYDVGKTFKTMKNYYAFKRKYCGVITDFLPSELKEILANGSVMLSPYRTSIGGGILLIRMAAHDLNSFTPEDMIAAAYLAAEIGIETDASQVCGSSSVFDFTGLSVLHLRHFMSRTLMSVVIKAVQDCLPYRLNSLHLVHEPMLATVCFSLIKPLMSPKMRDRIHFHGNDHDSLHKFIPKHCLPEHLGGTLKPKDYRDFQSIIQRNEKLAEKINTYTWEGKESKYFKLDSRN